jgi:threonine aldolase
MLGGGMRQAGILAAAGLYALEHNRARLADDHANATAFAESLAECKAVTVRMPATNLVLFDHLRASGADVMARAKDRGVLLGSGTTATSVRAVAHLDVDRAAVLHAAKVIAEIAAAL